MPPGTYWLGLELENLNYALAEDTSRLQEVQILDGSWMFRHAFQSLGAESVSVAAGDLDGDGAVDLIFRHCESGSAHNEVYWNNGDGTFVSGYSFHEAPSIIPGGSLRLGDLNTDGDLDLVEVSLFDSDANEPTTLRVYLNDGSGVFVDAELVDVDGDGDLDLVTAGIVNYLYYNVMYSPDLGPKKGDANPSDDQPPYAADSEGSSGLSSAEAGHDLETGTSGNGVVESGEDCDSSDGRSADCQYESHWAHGAEAYISESSSASGNSLATSW